MMLGCLVLCCRMALETDLLIGQPELHTMRFMTIATGDTGQVIFVLAETPAHHPFALFHARWAINKAL